MDVPVTNPQDDGQITSSNDDMLSRRLKNRERQRRYRERKRLRADTSKVLDTNQLTSQQVEVPIIVAQDSILPANVASLDSAVPVNVSPLYSAVPVNVTPLYSAAPVNVAPLYSAVQVNVAPLCSALPMNVPPQEFVMPVDVASGECVMPVSSTSRDPVTRVYSGRNWKIDARKAHATRQTEVSSNGSVSPNLASNGGNQAPSVLHVEQSHMVVSSPVTALENNGTPKSIPSRRHWKAEARNKRS